MLSWLRTRAARRERAADLYGAVVAQARAPAFYATLDIPDTPEGRYEMVVLHLVLVLERLRADGEAGKAPSRELIETFVADMDGSMREMGIGDLTVPKKVKGAAAGLYGRAEALRAGMAAGAAPGGLEAAITRLTLGREDGAADARAAPLARYYRAAAAALAGQSAADVLAGRLAFPAVAPIAAAGPVEETGGG